MSANKQEEIAQMMLSHLEGLRNDLKDLKRQYQTDMRDVKFRLRQIEETTHHHSSRFDGIEERLGRIEKRLDLVEA